MKYYDIVHEILWYRACKITGMILCITLHSKVNASLILVLFIFTISEQDYFYANLLSTLSKIVVPDIFTSVLAVYQFNPSANINYRK